MYIYINLHRNEAIVKEQEANGIPKFRITNIEFNFIFICNNNICSNLKNSPQIEYTQVIR